MSVDRKKICWLGIIVFVTGCTTIGAVQLEQRFGKPAPRERVVDALPAEHGRLLDRGKPRRRETLRRMPRLLRRALPIEIGFDRGHRARRLREKSLCPGPPEARADDPLVRRRRFSRAMASPGIFSGTQ